MFETLTGLLTTLLTMTQPIKRFILISASVLLLAGMIAFPRLRNITPPAPPIPAATVEQARKEAYDSGYANGYDTAQEEGAAAYQRGYDTAKKEIGSGAFTRFGALGFFVGLCLSAGAFVLLKQRELSDYVEEWRRRAELKHAFRRIPEGLSPDLTAFAQQIARTHSLLQHQLRRSKGYVFDQYRQEWQGKLRAMMNKSEQLLETTRELETARRHIDEKDLTKTIRGLTREVQSPDSDDVERNAAMKSLQRARQTQQELLTTDKNLAQCRASLDGMNGALESMRLKISNLKVNTQHTDLLDELSTDLQSEMSALEEVLQNMR